MKQLQLLNAVLAAAGAALGLILAVVCVIYWVHLDAAPKMRAELPLLLASTLSFAALMIAGGLAFHAHKNNWSLRWAVQLLPLLPLAGTALLLTNLE